MTKKVTMSPLAVAFVLAIQIANLAVSKLIQALIPLGQATVLHVQKLLEMLFKMFSLMQPVKDTELVLPLQ